MLKKKNLDPEKEAELQKEPKEKGDVPAMLLAAFLNLFLPAVIALLIFAGLIWLVFYVRRKNVSPFDMAAVCE